MRKVKARVLNERERERESKDGALNLFSNAENLGENAEFLNSNAENSSQNTQSSNENSKNSRTNAKFSNSNSQISNKNAEFSSPNSKNSRQNSQTYTKHFPAHNCELKVDFKNQRLIYPPELKRDSDTTSNFSQNENFVVFECVCRLLERGYKPQDLTLEKTWTLGHTGKSGRADISIAKEGAIYCIIECKTAGREFSAAKKDLETNKDGKQLFSYAAQARSVKWLCLYASDFDERGLSYKDIVIKFKDDKNILELNKKDKNLLTFKGASEAKDFFEVWDETYSKKAYENGLIFKSNAYEIGTSPLCKKDLKAFDKSEGINIKFQEILRHNNISARHNAFDILLNLFLVKCYDESTKKDDEKLDFGYFANDDYFNLYKRLMELFVKAMKELLNEEVYKPQQNFVSRTIKTYLGKNRAQAINELEKEIEKAHLYSAQFFSFKRTYNEKLFEQNGKVLAEVVQLFEPYRFTHSSDEQFLGELFEKFLNEGFQQNEGIYFTPTPITRFVWNSLPFEEFINSKGDFPKVLDFACGAGHFLTEGVSAIREVLKTRGEKMDSEKLSKLSSHFFGIDKDERLATTSKITMLLNEATNSKIRFIDGLEYDPEFYGTNQQDFDILVSNPPYSVKGFKEHLSRAVLDAKKGNVRYEVLEHTSLNSAAIENAFVERLTHILKPNALAAIVLPSSFLTNNDLATLKAREILLLNFAIYAICSFGNQTFGTTGTNTIILFLRRFNEPPKKAQIYQDSVNAILSGEDLTNFEDERILNAYLELLSSKFSKDFSDYADFVSENLDYTTHFYFKEYFKDFENLDEIKKLKAKNDFKKLDANAQQSELKRRFFAFAKEKEREKLTFFALTYSQNTLIVKAPEDTDEQKRFLGFVIRNAKNKSAGLTETEGLLSDKKDRNAPNKIAFVIKNAFKGEFAPSEHLKPYLSYTQSSNLLNFEAVNFTKSISLAVSGSNAVAANPFENSKFELVKVGDFITEQAKSKIQVQAAKENASGKFPFFTSGQNIYRHDTALVSGENIFLSTGGNALVQFYDGESAYSTDTYAITSRDENALLTKFIFLLLQNITPIINEFYFKGMGLKHLQKGDFKNIKIPKPPREIQLKIVAECEQIDKKASAINRATQSCREFINAILVKCAVANAQEVADFADFFAALETSLATLCHSEGATATEESTNAQSADFSLLQAQNAENSAKLNALDLSALKTLIRALPTPPPQGWERMKLGDKEFFELNPSKQEIASLNDDTLVSFVEMASVSDNGYIQNKVDKNLREVKKGYTYFAENDILIAKITPCMENGKCAIATNLTNGVGFGSTEFHIFRAKKAINQKLLFLYLNREEIRQAAAKNMTGMSGHKRVPITFYENLTIPLLNAQESIIKAVEWLENAIFALNAAAENLAPQKAQILQKYLF